VDYVIEKPSNKLLAAAYLDSGTWARSKKLKSGRRDIGITDCGGKG
jgi:hypothetical protein